MDNQVTGWDSLAVKVPSAWVVVCQGVLHKYKYIPLTLVSYVTARLSLSIQTIVDCNDQKSCTNYSYVAKLEERSQQMFKMYTSTNDMYGVTRTQHGWKFSLWDNPHKQVFLWKFTAFSCNRLTSYTYCTKSYHNSIAKYCANSRGYMHEVMRILAQMRVDHVYIILHSTRHFAWVAHEILCIGVLLMWSRSYQLVMSYVCLLSWLPVHVLLINCTVYSSAFLSFSLPPPQSHKVAQEADIHC